MRPVGYYKMHRGWMDNPVLRDCEERIVWLSIIERAAWADTTTYFNGQVVEVKRGSFFTSLRLCASTSSGMPRRSAASCVGWKTAT